MFFKLHSEGKIGYKELTPADLGRGQGNTTHIGIFGDILTFLPNKQHEDISMFIYDNKSDPLSFSFDRIERKNGEMNSPKIKKGGKNVVSVVTVIQNIANNLNPSLKWYLLWFGLESEEVVFYLFNDNSDDYQFISKIIDISNSLVKGKVESSDSNFLSLISYLEQSVNKSNIENIKELETVSQIGISKKFRNFDIDKANSLFKETGRRGEEIIAQYLDFLISKGQIFNYTWANKSLESGLPYDFTIQEKSQNIIHIDVKATLYKFDQPLIFSGQELEFISKIPSYNIFRIYNLSEENLMRLRICENGKGLAVNLNPHISFFKNNMQSLNVGVQSVKLAVLPTASGLEFKSEINITKILQG